MPAMTRATRWSVPLALLLAAPALTAPPLSGATPAPADPAPAPAAAPTPPGELVAPPVTVVPFIQPFDLDATRRMAGQVLVGGEPPFSFPVDTRPDPPLIPPDP